VGVVPPREMNGGGEAEFAAHRIIKHDRDIP
jgi:hypothetical protein